jgi:phage FluMu protein Com
VSNEILDRWRGFVTKVTGRMQEILAEASAGFDGLLADPNLEALTFQNAMLAIEQRCKQLRISLDTTYSQNVVMPLMGQVGDAEVLLRSSGEWMDATLERFRVAHNDKLVRALWPRVEALMKAPVACTQCGATLTRTVFHQSESIKCPHCAAVNSVSPDLSVGIYFSLAPTYYAQGQTVEMKLALDQAERAGRSPAEREPMVVAYWTAYARASAQIAPMDPAEQQRFVQGKVDALRRFG